MLFLIGRHSPCGSVSLDMDFERELTAYDYYDEGLSCGANLSVFDVKVERDGSCTRYYCEAEGRKVLAEYLDQMEYTVVMAVPAPDGDVCFATYN